MEGKDNYILHRCGNGGAGAMGIATEDSGADAGDERTCAKGIVRTYE